MQFTFSALAKDSYRDISGPGFPVEARRSFTFAPPAVGGSYAANRHSQVMPVPPSALLRRKTVTLLVGPENTLRAALAGGARGRRSRERSGSTAARASTSSGTHPACSPPSKRSRASGSGWCGRPMPEHWPTPSGDPGRTSSSSSAIRGTSRTTGRCRPSPWPAGTVHAGAIPQCCSSPPVWMICFGGWRSTGCSAWRSRVPGCSNSSRCRHLGCRRPGSNHGRGQRYVPGSRN